MYNAGFNDQLITYLYFSLRTGVAKSALNKPINYKMRNTKWRKKYTWLKYFSFFWTKLREG